MLEVIYKKNACRVVNNSFSKLSVASAVNSAGFGFNQRYPYIDPF